MMLRKLGYCVVLLLGLSACGGVSNVGAFLKSPVTGVVSSEEDKTKRENFRLVTREGAVNALNLANDHGDIIGAQCYQGIIDYIDSKPGVVIIEKQHALVIFERGRLGLKRLNEGIPKPLLIACGPLYADAKADISKLGLLLGVAF